MSKEISLPNQAHFADKRYDEVGTFCPIDDLDCDLFLDNLRKYGIPSRAARELGRGEIAFQVERSKNKAFSDAWDWAIRESYMALEFEARRRAVEGVKKDIWYKDEVVGEEIVYSDTLLLALLKANHPAFGGSTDDLKSPGSSPVGTITISPIPAGKFIELEAVDPDNEL